MKVYIAGKITGLENYKLEFEKAETFLKLQGHRVLNPSILPYPGFEHHEYMHICFAMIDVCDAVFLLENWTTSDGAKMEIKYAIDKGKRPIYSSGKLKIIL